MSRPVPVIAIDGPAASGKGTLAVGVATALGFHLLDSGALYRLVALSALRAGVAPNDGVGLARVAAGMDLTFTPGGIRLGGDDVTEAIREEAVSATASRVAVHPGVRSALLAWQRGFRRPPGLVADGRDMGTVVFADATLKVFLTASREARAERRHKQLIAKGISITIESLLRELEARDERDSARAAAPLQAAADAVHLDTTDLTPAAAVAHVLDLYRARTS